jgi:hypothetical protein
MLVTCLRSGYCYVECTLQPGTTRHWDRNVYDDPIIFTVFYM